LTAMLAVKAKDELSARKALLRALQANREVRLPSAASPRFRKMLEDERGLLARSPKKKGGDKPLTLFAGEDGRKQEARRKAAEREPPSKAVIGAVDALCSHDQTDAARVVLQGAR